MTARRPRRPDPAASAERSRQLADEVPRRARVDLGEAARLAADALRLARASRDLSALARATRARGHVAWFGADYPAAERHYAQASRWFVRLGDDLQTAITYSGSLQTLIYLGRYQIAHRRARQARAIFARLGDRVRLARLESNVGNIYYRQDRFRRAIRCYERAAADLRVAGEHHDVALALRNMAVCLVSLYRFESALEVHREARDYGCRHEMRLFVAETDYNIAYLYFLRGEYERALELYGAARAHCAEVGDAYHRALCDLDEAELCLELNDHARARVLAAAAATGFGKLALRYERAKAISFHAAARVGQGDLKGGLTDLMTARRLFAADRNRAWMAAVDLAQAVALCHAGRFAEARRLVERSPQRRALHAGSMRRSLWDLLRARLDLAEGRDRSALATARATVSRIGRGAAAPGLLWQAYQVLGEAHEACGATIRAERCYQRARRSVDWLWTQLSTDSLKIAFLTDKRVLYERLFALALSRTTDRGAAESAFEIVEEAKSRSLADLMAFRAARVPPRSTAATAPAGAVRTLHQEVRAVAHELASEELRNVVDRPKLKRLRAARAGRYRALATALSDLRSVDPELAALQTGGVEKLASVRGALGEGVALIEYFQADGSFFGLVLQAGEIQAVRLGAIDRVAEALSLLRFQLAKFRLGPDYLRTFSNVLFAAAMRHLRDLHALLMAPLLPRLAAAELVIVPHGQLHYLPFHALYDGGRHLIDDYIVSYAPSATVFGLCHAKPPAVTEGSLVVALDDAFAPHIAREAQEVAGLLPEACVYTGTQATLARLTRDMPAARYAHIATHGVFRRDNPMLSSIRLADGDLTLADLYDLRLDAELVTLSGCGTGLSAVVGGDELVGLTRGLLYAGARSLLLTMWQVDDYSTSEFMGHFYRHLAAGAGRAAAAAAGMRAVRARFAHPYYWAPFLLVGQPGPVQTWHRTPNRPARG